MASTCSCRTTVLRTFVRSVAQLHIPSDNLARAAPWHEARRQLHQARATRWPAVSGLPYRSIRTAATDSSAAAAVQVEGEGQTGTVEDTGLLEITPRGMGDIDMLAQEVAAETAKGSVKLEPLTLAKPRKGKASKTPDLEDPEEKPKKTRKVRKSKKTAALEPSEEKPKRTRKGKESEAPADKKTKRTKVTESSSKETKRTRRKPPVQEEVVSEHSGTVSLEDPHSALEDTDLALDDSELERISVEEIEAEQQEREEARALARAERKAAREKAKAEKQEQLEIAQRRAAKERLQNRPLWASQKEALKVKFPEGWRPRRKLSPDALNGIRALNAQFPDTYTTEVLSNKFEVSPEAIRRILKSRWEPTAEEEEDRQRRWHNRGIAIWEMYEAVGKKPPAKWRTPPTATDEIEKNPRRKSRGWYDEEMEEPQDDPERRKRALKVQRIESLSKHLL